MRKNCLCFVGLLSAGTLLVLVQQMIGQERPAHLQPLFSPLAHSDLIPADSPVDPQRARIEQVSATTHSAAMMAEGTSETGPSAQVAQQRPSLPAHRRSPLPVHPLLPPTTPISHCQGIFAPGRYVLTQDLTSAASCILVLNVQGGLRAPVSLDCQGHSITISKNSVGIFVGNSQHVSITNCTSLTDAENDGLGVKIMNSEYISVMRNTADYVYVSGSTDTLIEDNDIRGTYFQASTSFTAFIDNTVVWYADKNNGLGVISSYNGGNNLFIGNTLDGKWDGKSSGATLQGSDDGVVLGYEHDDQLQNNTIQNVWDIGIENVGLLSNALIANNHIANVAYAAVAGAYNSGWENNMLIGNQVTNSGWFAEYAFSPSADHGPVPSKIIFENNQIISNVFTKPRANPDGSFQNAMYLMAANLPNATVTLPVMADNNILMNNVLPLNTPSPILLPASAFIDGGGNVCSVPSSSIPIVCNAK